MTIVAFVDTSEARHDLAIELAVAAAEFSLDEDVPLYLLTDAITALEVGISLIGSRESRVVEGGEYRASPIRLLPFIQRSHVIEDGFLRGESESGEGGDISELFDLGLFARPQERGEPWEAGDEPATALLKVIEAVRPEQIVGLGRKSAYWKTVGESLQESTGGRVPRVITIDGFEPDDTDKQSQPFVVRRPDIRPVGRRESERPSETDALEEQRLAAERDGQLVAGFIQFLVGNTRGRRVEVVRTR